jgi:hypothetical protein
MKSSGFFIQINLNKKEFPSAKNVLFLFLHFQCLEKQVRQQLTKIKR